MWTRVQLKEIDFTGLAQARVAELDATVSLITVINVVKAVSRLVTLLTVICGDKISEQIIGFKCVCQGATPLSDHFTDAHGQVCT